MTSSENNISVWYFCFRIKREIMENHFRFIIRKKCFSLQKPHTKKTLFSINLILQRHHNANANVARSIPPPSDRPRNQASSSGAGSSSAHGANRSGGGGGDRGEGRRGQSSRPSHSGRPTAHGYGEGRGQYYPPKGVFYKPVRS